MSGAVVRRASDVAAMERSGIEVVIHSAKFALCDALALDFTSLHRGYDLSEDHRLVPQRWLCIAK